MKKKLLLSVIAICFTSWLCTAQTEEEFRIFSHTGNVLNKNTITKIPIEYFNNIIILKVKLNDQELRFMWDNGFSISGIDNSWIDPLKMVSFGNPNNTIKLLDGNNAQVNLEYLYGNKLQIGSITVTQTPFLHFETRTITQSQDLLIDGVLGSSVINKLNWKFNFDEGFVEVSDKPFDTSKTNIILPFQINSNNLHYFSISFNDSKFLSQIDFGSNSPDLEINSQYAKLFKNSKASKILGQSSISVGGMAPVDTSYTIKDNYTWKLEGVDLKFKPKINFSNSNREFVIGNQIFRSRYNLIINTSEDKVYALTHRKKTEIKNSDKAFGYLMLLQDGKFKIIQIHPNKNTAKHKLNLQDEILLINGKKPTDFIDNNKLIKYQKDLMEKNLKLELTLANKKVIKLKPVPLTFFNFNDDTNLW